MHLGGSQQYVTEKFFCNQIFLDTSGNSAARSSNTRLALPFDDDIDPIANSTEVIQTTVFPIQIAQ